MTENGDFMKQFRMMELRIDSFVPVYWSHPAVHYLCIIENKYIFDQ